MAPRPSTTPCAAAARRRTSPSATARTGTWDSAIRPRAPFSYGDPHGQDQAAFHRDRDRYRRAQRLHPVERRGGEGPSLRAAGKGRPRETPHGGAPAPLPPPVRGPLRRRAPPPPQTPKK